MIRDSEFSDSVIGKFILSDSVGRNQYLNTFIGALNSIDKNTYISLDANWGSGKTVFVKQIEYLNLYPLDDFSIPNIDSNTLTDFKNKYVVFYYNAWENDYHDDPLQSLLFNLIDKLYTDKRQKAKVKALAKSTVKTIAKEAVKTFSKGLVDIDKISNVETIDGLVSNITVVNERKKAIADIISKILPDDKKLLFIIDELDRCNPEFAVRLMEVTKHYYNDDKVVFVLATNNRQLVHTVKKYYGNDFDGYGYLDKLYDLPLELPPVDIEKYFATQLSTPNNSEWVNIIPLAIAKHLNMTMREANRYNAVFSFVKGQLTSATRWYSNDNAPLLTYFVFIPLALALKIRDIEQYDKFISGEGESILKALYESNDIFTRIGTIPDNQKPIDIAIASYKSIVHADKIPYDQAHHNIRQAGEFFKNILPLIASVSKIDDSKEEDDNK